MSASLPLRVALLAAALASTSAFAGPGGALAARPAGRLAAPRMLAPAPLPLPAAAATAAPATALLVADVLDTLQGFAGSPLLLLVPIGAGTLVASIIIYLLVKSAG